MSSYITLRPVRIATEYSVRYRQKDSPPGVWAEFDAPHASIDDAEKIAGILADRYGEDYTIQIVALHVDVCSEIRGRYRPPVIRSR